jgi:hypothetical protein
MPLKDAKKRERVAEDEYFHRLDAELLEQMRKRAALEEERRQLAEVSNDQRLSDEVFQTAVRALRASMETLPPNQNEAGASSLLEGCADVASASGGLFGLTNRVSTAERKLLNDLARQLELDHPAAPPQVVGDTEASRP